MRILYIIIAFVLSSSYVFSQTQVGGTLMTNSTWNLSGSPYTLTSTLGVAEGVTLIIEPGVVVTTSANFDLLVKGNIISNGSESLKIKFTNARILFKSTNLANSQISYITFNACGLQLGDEGEQNQDATKNSGTLTVSNCTFSNNSYAYTKGYASSANLVVQNSLFDNSTIKGYYPLTEQIVINNCKINNSIILSDSYNKGIHLTGTEINLSQVKMGCCSANYSFSECHVSNSVVYGCCGNPINGDFIVTSSTFNNSPIILPYANLSLTLSNFFNKGNIDVKLDIWETINNAPTIKFGHGVINKCTFDGGGLHNSLIVTGYAGYNIGGNTSINSCLFKNCNDAISIENFSSIEILKCNFDGINNFFIKNNANKIINAQSNYWGTTNTSEISAKIYDMYDDINSGVVDYSNYLSSPTSDAPVSCPENVIKGLNEAGEVIVKWNGNLESDLAGYNLYYKKTNDNYYVNSVNVGNVNSFKVSGIDLSDDIVVTAYDNVADGLMDIVEGHESNYSEKAKNQFKIDVLSGESYCETSKLQIKLEALTTFQADNKFIVFLSESKTNFENAFELGKVDTSVSFISQFELPTNLSYNKDYYIAVKSSNTNTLSNSYKIIKYVTPSSEFSINKNFLCDLETAFITYNGLSSVSSTFTWTFDNANVLSGAKAGPYELNWTSSGEKVVSLVVSQNGCSSATKKDTINVFRKPTSSFTIPSIVCGDNSVLLKYTGTGTSKAKYSWDMGKTIVISDSIQGIFEVKWNALGVDKISLIVEENGCISDTTRKNIAINVQPSSFFEVDSFLQCGNNLLKVKYLGNASNKANFNWNFDNATIQNDSTFGIYQLKWGAIGKHNLSLEVIENGCKSIITRKNIRSYKPVANFSLQNTACENDIVEISFNGTASDSADLIWDFNEATILSESIAKYKVKWNSPGRKSISVVVDDNGCKSDTVIKHIDYTQVPTINFAGIGNVCHNGGSQIKYTGNASDSATYHWDLFGNEVLFADTLSEMNVFWTTSGDKTILFQVEDKDCMADSTFSLFVSDETAGFPICMVTTNNEGHNSIYWEKIENHLYDSIIIYKELMETGEYIEVGAVDALSTTNFVDINSESNLIASRYSISAYDTCGTETALSGYHKTMHLSISGSINGAWNLLWNKYEGVDYDHFVVYRGSSPDNLQAIAEQKGNTFTFTDVTPPEGELFYKISVESISSCVINESSSNIVSTNLSSLISHQFGSLNVYPNPANDELFVELTSNNYSGELSILSMDGKRLMKQNITKDNVRIDISNLSNDLYIVELNTGQTILYSRFIKQ